MNKYQDALDFLCDNSKLTQFNIGQSQWASETLQDCINENKALKEIIKGIRNENFVHILTHNGIKYAFQNRLQVDDFINKNDMKKVHLISIQYYREKPLDWSEDE